MGGNIPWTGVTDCIRCSSKLSVSVHLHTLSECGYRESSSVKAVLDYQLDTPGMRGVALIISQRNVCQTLPQLLAGPQEKGLAQGECCLPWAGGAGLHKEAS